MSAHEKDTMPGAKARIWCFCCGCESVSQIGQSTPTERADFDHGTDR